MDDSTQHPTQLSATVTRRLSRRGLLGMGAALGLTTTLAACGSSTTSSATDTSSGTPTDAASASGAGTAGSASASASTTAGVGATVAAGSTAASASNTKLSAGSYKATFSSTGSGGMGNAAGGAAGGGAKGGGSASGKGGTPPSGGAPGGSAPGGSAPGGSAPGGSASAGGAPGGSGMSSGGSQTLKGAYLVDGVHATIEGGTWNSTTADQNVFLVVNGGSLTIKDAAIVKSGNTASEDSSNFYGMNAAVLVVGEKSSVTMTNCRVTTASEGSNALFATNGATLTAAQVTIRTSKNSSRGLDATYEGRINASGMDIATTGAHCACVATDRGNGTVRVTGTNLLSTSGDGSPLIYSTGDIAVAGATGTSTGAQTMVIEGKNKITVANCSLTTTGTEGMMIYQSFSGDAADSSATASHSTMSITNCTITSKTARPMIYVTNTTCVVTVSSSRLAHSSSSKLLDLEADHWGTTGSNGGHATVTLASCGALGGNLTAGSTSAATVKLTGGTTLSGTTSGSVTVTKA